MDRSIQDYSSITIQDQMLQQITKKMQQLSDNKFHTIRILRSVTIRNVSYLSWGNYKEVHHDAN